MEAKGGFPAVLRDLQTLYSAGTLLGLTDCDLLERFQSANREGDDARAEAALTALVNRHAAMVWNVCRSVLRDPHDAEDAFQATFLILVRKAGSLHVGETLGPWLHVVAYRTALSVRTAVARRWAVERSAAAMRREADDPAEPDVSSGPADELRASIHAEIMGLPEAFRVVVVLCDLEGLSYVEAARRLDIPLGTVQSRLARARGRLRRSLALRGIHPSDEGESRDPSGASGFGWMTAGGLPPRLVGRVGRLGALIASDPAHLKTTAAGSVQALIERGLRSMFLSNVKRVLFVSLGGVLVGGIFVYTDARSGQTGQDGARPEDRPAASKGEVKKRIEVPAPRQLSVASGHGKVLLYRLDRTGVRIPLRRDGEVVRFQQAEREIRWAVVTGLIDHDRVQESLIMADRRPLPSSEQIYRRVELERQTLQKDGSRSDWGLVDMNPTLKILDNLQDIDGERVAQQFRVDSLVDPLPRLTTGSWKGVDVEELVAPELRGREDRPFAPAPRANPQKDRPPVLMVRTFDFTVESGLTYRYRARVVLFNHGRKQTDPRELIGPWSDATDIIKVPQP